MTNMQRMKSDMETIDRREIADQTMKNSRNRNDEITGERRCKADKTMRENRLRNDELTANRRDIKDGNMGMGLAISLLVLLAVTIGVFFVFI